MIFAVLTKLDGEHLLFILHRGAFADPCGARSAQTAYHCGKFAARYRPGVVPKFRRNSAMNALALSNPSSGATAVTGSPAASSSSAPTSRAR